MAWLVCFMLGEWVSYFWISRRWILVSKVACTMAQLLVLSVLPTCFECTYAYVSVMRWWMWWWGWVKLCFMFTFDIKIVVMIMWFVCLYTQHVSFLWSGIQLSVSHLWSLYNYILIWADIPFVMYSRISTWRFKMA